MKIMRRIWLLIQTLYKVPSTWIDKNESKAMTLLGLTVIFATFIAKELRRDKMKDLMESIHTAENIYVIRGDNRKNLVHILDIKRRVLELNETRDTKPSHSHEDKIDWDLLEQSWTDDDAIPGTISDLARLLDILPYGAPQVELNNVNKTFKTTEQELNDDENEADKLDQERSDKNTRTRVSALNKELENVQKKYQDLWNNLESVNEKSLDLAEHEHDRAAESFEDWSDTYFWLFGFGWIVSVLGVIYGDEKDHEAIKKFSEGD